MSGNGEAMSSSSGDRLLGALRRLRPDASGVVWYGPVLHVGGYGNATRAYLKALTRLGLRTQAVNINLDHTPLLDPGAVELVRALMNVDAGARPIEIIHGEPTAYPRLGTPLPAARIGATVFETMSIPADWVAPLNGMDAVWVPTEFHRRTFSEAGVEPSKIRVVPFAIDTDFFAPRPRPAGGPFRFLYASIWDFRKGIDLLARAFVQEFQRGEDVELVIQTSIPELHGDDAQHEALARLRDAIGEEVGGTPRIDIRTRTLSQPELRDLYATCDLYISTDRNNIWTLPCIEVLSMGRPCATTDYARATSFLDDDNPLLIRCSDHLLETDPELARLRPLYRGQRWADFTLDEVRRAMRFAYNEREGLSELTERGRAYVLDHHSVAAVSRPLSRALDTTPRRAHVRMERVVPTLLGYNTPARSRRRAFARLLGGARRAITR